MSKRYDVVAARGSYKTNDSQEKVRWTNHGAVFEKDGKFSLKLDSLPTGEWDGWFKLFEPKQRGQQQTPPVDMPRPDANKDAYPPSDEFDDGIPF